MRYPLADEARVEQEVHATQCDRDRAVLLGRLGVLEESLPVKLWHFGFGVELDAGDLEARRYPRPNQTWGPLSRTSPSVR